MVLADQENEKIVKIPVDLRPCTLEDKEKFFPDLDSVMEHQLLQMFCIDDHKSIKFYGNSEQSHYSVLRVTLKNCGRSTSCATDDEINDYKSQGHRIKTFTSSKAYNHNDYSEDAIRPQTVSHQTFLTQQSKTKITYEVQVNEVHSEHRMFDLGF